MASQRQPSARLTAGRRRSTEVQWHYFNCSCFQCAAGGAEEHETAKESTWKYTGRGLHVCLHFPNTCPRVFYVNSNIFLCIKVKQNKARVTPACVLWCKENSRDVKAFFSEKFHLAEFLFFLVNGVKNTDEQLFKHRAAAKQARLLSLSLTKDVLKVLRLV